ncbi:MAG: [acyl-carrier-protein] S-malonyltransferase [Omnitrophica WOR_2 bacterium RIFCSPLOWO2_12_FULL_51_8]|nr:MAG: [acyl-carrier-protein] S-malonyltransferase [Omnitrophica WOR_2 bacterium RIFCSPLOWO2_12_FULL_51_8]
MGKDLYASFPESKRVFEKADEVLGFSLSGLIFGGPGEALINTVTSQPAILAASIAAFEAFRQRSGVKPAYLAGLSLGEYSALIAAGSLSFEAGLRLVRKRAEIMEEAAHRHPGGMAAVLDLPIGQLRDICLKAGAEIANINAPGQVVISGKKEAVGKASVLAQEAGAKRVIALEVSGGFHSSLMLEASAEFKPVLESAEISPAVIPVVSNYTARPQYQPAEIRENLAYQIHSPVRWEESMRFILSCGVSDFIEFGPGRILNGLLRRIDPSAQVISIEKKEDILNKEGKDAAER